MSNSRMKGHHMEYVEINHIQKIIDLDDSIYLFLTL